MMERKYWARMRQQQLYAEVSKHNIVTQLHRNSIIVHVSSLFFTFQSSTRSSSASSGSAVDVESIVDLHRSPAKISTPLPDDKQPSEAESAEPKEDTTTAGEVSKPTVSEGEEGKRETEESAELEEDDEQSSPVASEEQLREDAGEKESVEPAGEPAVTEEGLEMEKSEGKEEKSVEEGITGPPEVFPAQAEESVVIVNSEDSGTELTKILLEAFRRYTYKFNSHSTYHYTRVQTFAIQRSRYRC